MSLFWEVSRKKSVKWEVKIEENATMSRWNCYAFLTAEYEEGRDASHLSVEGEYQGERFFSLEASWDSDEEQIDHSIGTDGYRFEGKTATVFLSVMKELMAIPEMNKEELLAYFRLN